MFCLSKWCLFQTITSKAGKINRIIDYSIDKFHKNDYRYWFANNRLFVFCGCYITVSMLMIRTSHLFTIHFLKFEQTRLLPNVVSQSRCMSGKQCRPWWDATFYGVSSGSTTFAQACRSEYIRQSITNGKRHAQTVSRKRKIMIKSSLITNRLWQDIDYLFSPD